MHTHPLNQKVADPGGSGGRVLPYMRLMSTLKGMVFKQFTLGSDE